LHQQGYLSVSPTGYFGSLTQAAVEQYQTAHGLEAVGNVGPLTRASLNGGSSNGSTAPAQTSTSKLTQAQIQSILNLLASFGADQATLARVAAILGYQATTTAQEGGGGSPQAGTPTTIQNFAPSGGGGGSSSSSSSGGSSSSSSDGSSGGSTPAADATPPSVTITAPATNLAANTAQTLLTAATNEAATCNYSTNSA